MGEAIVITSGKGGNRFHCLFVPNTDCLHI